MNNKSTRNTREDVYDVPERHQEFIEDEYYECFGCGWYGKDYIALKEYGMVFFLCPVCGAEV